MRVGASISRKPNIVAASLACLVLLGLEADVCAQESGQTSSQMESWEMRVGAATAVQIPMLSLTNPQMVSYMDIGSAEVGFLVRLGAHHGVGASGRAAAFGTASAGVEYDYSVAGWHRHGVILWGGLHWMTRTISCGEKDCPFPYENVDANFLPASGPNLWIGGAYRRAMSDGEFAFNAGGSVHLARLDVDREDYRHIYAAEGRTPPDAIGGWFVNVGPRLFVSW